MDLCTGTQHHQLKKEAEKPPINKEGGNMSEKTVCERIKQFFEGIHSERIKEAARKPDNLSSWTRQRDMPLYDILTCTLAKKGLSTVMEVRQYFQAVGKEEQTISKQGYLQQRQKLNPEAFKLLNSDYLKSFYEGKEVVLWNGYIVCVADGSRAEIPNSEENRKTYGTSTNNYGETVARANVNILYDVYNRFLINLVIERYNHSEIEEVKTHIDSLKEITGGRPVLIVLDRYYASLEFLDILEKAGIKYLVRVQKGRYNPEIGQMQGADEEVALRYTLDRLLTVRDSEPERFKELKQKKSVRVRVLKTVSDNGEPVP